MDHRMKSMVIGTMIGVALVAFIVVILIWKTSSSCKPSTTEPLIGDLSKLKNVADTTDYKSMATFDGYLIYNPDEQDGSKLYRSLSLNSVSYKESTGANQASLALITDCAKVDLKLVEWEVTRIEIDLTVAKGEESWCIIQKPGISSSFSSHYACSTQISYKCYTKSGARLDLVINRLEFEYLGDPISIKEGIYSTLQKVCRPKIQR